MLWNRTLVVLVGCLGLWTSVLRVSAAEDTWEPVVCEGVYPKHLQGVCTDQREAIFWCFTTVLVKTDLCGKVLKSVPVVSHHGDLCYRDRMIYVAVNLGKFNLPAGEADSWIYLYDTADLHELSRQRIPEVVHGAGGIGFDGRRFLVVGGLPSDFNVNYAYEYDQDLRFVHRHEIQSGYTYLGIQTATYSRGHWWFGCYGNPRPLLKTDDALKLVGKYTFDASYGIAALDDGRFLTARDRRQGVQHRADVVLAEVDAQQGLVVRTADKGEK